MIRVGPVKLDDDNLRGALKACRDGLADALGVDDGDSCLTWAYGQKQGKRDEWSVEVTVELDPL